MGPGWIQATVTEARSPVPDWYTHIAYVSHHDAGAVCTMAGQGKEGLHHDVGRWDGG